MDYNETLEYLYRQLPMFSRVGAAAYKPGLDTSLRLDNFFGNPHKKFKSIHVAGTNGKGSCSHLLAASLQAQGYKTGLYTSPHLVDFRERMRINGEMIPQQEVVDFIAKYLESGYEGRPSFFELTMMMAFAWFEKEKVDYAVIETGMGGRLDSTNIITPMACVITNISMDHTQFLGSSPEKIAAEKAGIIKAGIPVVVGEAEGKVKQVFAQKAAEVEAPIVFAQDSPMLISAEARDGGFECEGKEIGAFFCELGGDYQRKNINTVLCAQNMLRGVGVELGAEACKKGFAKVCALTGLAGRWMKLSDYPLTICDTGHNAAGLQSNMVQLQSLLKARPGAKLRFVAGFVADKDIAGILRLLPTEAQYYVTNAGIPRALPAKELLLSMQKANLDVSTERLYPGSVEDAYAAALAASEESDIIYVGGSTFVVADLLASRH